MSTLQQLRDELSARLGFGAQDGAEVIQGPMLESILQRSQDNILSEFGSQLHGTTWPATAFEDPNDPPSVPDNALLLRAEIRAREHYRMPFQTASQAWEEYTRQARGFVA